MGQTAVPSSPLQKLSFPRSFERESRKSLDARLQSAGMTVIFNRTSAFTFLIRESRNNHEFILYCHEGAFIIEKCVKLS
jgi:hypothetical protein